MAFAASNRGLEYALVQDATQMTAGEIHHMASDERYMTAILRARWYEHLYGSGGGKQRP